jgi:hypothetical protein
MNNLIPAIPISFRTSTRTMALASAVRGRMPAATKRARDERIARNASPYEEHLAASRSQMMQFYMIACNIGVAAIKASRSVSIERF